MTINNAHEGEERAFGWRDGPQKRTAGTAPRSDVPPETTSSCVCYLRHSDDALAMAGVPVSPKAGIIQEAGLTYVTETRAELLSVFSYAGHVTVK